jgi:hypothetical protein
MPSAASTTGDSCRRSPSLARAARTYKPANTSFGSVRFTNMHDTISGRYRARFRCRSFSVPRKASPPWQVSSTHLPPSSRLQRDPNRLPYLPRLWTGGKSSRLLDGSYCCLLARPSASHLISHRITAHIHTPHRRSCRLRLGTGM